MLIDALSHLPLNSVRSGRALASCPLLVFSSLVLLTCGGSNSASEAVFEVQYCGDNFSVQVTSSEQIMRAARLLSNGHFSVISGRLIHGDGGVNAPWSWHMQSQTVMFGEFAVEVCDGCPHSVESDVSYWVDRLGQYCPWAARVTKRLR